MKLDAPAVRHRRLQMHVVVRPTTAVSDGQIERLCQRSNLHCFSITAHRTNVGLRDVDTTMTVSLDDDIDALRFARQRSGSMYVGASRRAAGRHSDKPVLQTR
jgi:hypothetical protein